MYSEIIPIGTFANALKNILKTKWIRELEGLGLIIAKQSDNVYSFVYKGVKIFKGTKAEAETALKEYFENSKKGGLEKYLDDLAEQFGKTINIVSKGKAIAKFTRGKELELIGISYKNIFGGTKIILKEGSTVAITGLLNDVREIKKLGRKMPGLWKQGVNIGATDLLSSPIWFEITNKHKKLRLINPKQYWHNVTNDFWEKVNQPWLDEIIKRGDDVRFVTNHNLEKSKYVYDEKAREFAIGLDGEKVPTIFSREVEYLKNHGGYEIKNELAIKIKK